VFAEVVRVGHAAAAGFAIVSAKKERVRAAAVGGQDADHLASAVEHQGHGVGVAEERKFEVSNEIRNATSSEPRSLRTFANEACEELKTHIVPPEYTKAVENFAFATTQLFQFY
jgi:hypothetical protein